MLTREDLAAFRQIAEALADSSREFHDYADPPKPKDRDDRRSWVYRLSDASRARLVNDLVLKMVGGHGYGLDPLDAVSNYWITPQFHQPHARYYLARMKSHPHYDCDVLESDAERCKLAIHRYNKVSSQWQRAEFVLTREDANRRNITTTYGGVKSQWKREPAKMLQWAAVREAMRVFCPDLLGEEPPPVDDAPDVEPVAASPASEPPVAGDAVAPSRYDRLRAFLDAGEACGFDASWKGVTSRNMLFSAFGTLAEHHGVEMPGAEEIDAIWNGSHTDRGLALNAWDAGHQLEKEDQS